MLKTLLDGQAKVTGNLLTAKALLHPIRSIPDDVLSYIFSFCVQEVYDLINKIVVHNSLDSRKPPWTLSQVCRSWRRVALSAAPLWKCLSLDFERYNAPEKLPLHSFMLGLHLQRARRHQLTIRLSSTTNIHSHVFLPILLTSMPHWKHLRVYVPSKTLITFSTYGGYLESLHYLDAKTVTQDLFMSPIHTFQKTRSLRTLKINSTLCHYICLPDSGNGLTDLTLCGPSVKHMFSVLGNAPNIKTLSVYFRVSNPFERLDLPIVMPKLTSLTIAEYKGAAPKSIIHLFESLELPALFYLKIGCDRARGSKIDIKTGLIAFLASISNLRHLSFAAKTVDKDVLSTLTRSNDNGDILPQLLTFDLRGSESIPKPKILLEMVESRQTHQGEGVVRLRKLQELYLDAPLAFDHSSWASRWQSLLRSGLINHHQFSEPSHMSGFHALLFITSWLLALQMTGLPSTFRISHIPLAEMSV
ncbi:hypothetical protein ARMGADRAFT_1033263 [Armillaria gallica]|uniref:Uncharacterized protein n=1 Tax=Armillaria gallica TaxID=47427 RepID=A0A2H3DCM5_ARMGA|nr:hypothetical protein ARMGADRAFT_1033263 [Armillaria gallica]